MHKTANHEVSFPQNSTSLFLHGQAGRLEVALQYPAHSARDDFIGIVCHPHPLHGGTMNNKVVTTAAKALNQLDIISIRFNYRGVGESEGSYGDMVGEYEDLQTIMDWVLYHFPKKNIFLIGFSFGAFITAKAASHPHVKHLTSIAPAITHVDYSVVPKLKCPWLVIHGELDELIWIKDVKKWSKQHNIKLHIIAHASHFFHGKLVELRDTLIQEWHAYLDTQHGT